VREYPVSAECESEPPHVHMRACVRVCICVRCVCVRVSSRTFYFIRVGRMRERKCVCVLGGRTIGLPQKGNPCIASTAFWALSTLSNTSQA